MLAILGGLGAAICWATSSLAAARSARLIGSWATVGWVMLIGVMVAVPATIVGGGGANLTPEAVTLLAISGAGNVVGLLLAYTAFKAGKVAVIAPIVSTEGAMGAVISVVLGEQIGIAAAIVLTAIAIGVILASSGREEAAVEPGGLVAEHETPENETPERAATDADALQPSKPAAPASTGPGHPGRKATIIAVAAALAFGINLYASARIGATLPLVWSILPARLGGFLFVALPLLLTGRLKLTRQALPLVSLVALMEIVGTGVYAFGSRDGIAVAAVTSSQFGAIAAVVSVVAFGERLRRIQVAGIVAIAVGVALLAAIQSS